MISSINLPPLEFLAYTLPKSVLTESVSVEVSVLSDRSTVYLKTIDWQFGWHYAESNQCQQDTMTDTGGWSVVPYAEPGFWRIGLHDKHSSTHLPRLRSLFLWMKSISSRLDFHRSKNRNSGAELQKHRSEKCRSKMTSKSCVSVLHICTGVSVILP